MSMERNGKPIDFWEHGRREVTASFDRALHLREADNVFGVTDRLAGCFADHRDPGRSAHVLCCRLRPSNIDASRCALDELARIVALVREAWPEVRDPRRPILNVPCLGVATDVSPGPGPSWNRL